MDNGDLQEEAFIGSDYRCRRQLAGLDETLVNDNDAARDHEGDNDANDDKITPKQARDETKKSFYYIGVIAVLIFIHGSIRRLR